ncbi:MAG: SpaA isopeptide-forming pilin-related protein [bacterium]|nr:SpaA isopeptide-forming pilin-related protein [bacterium]
MKKFIFILITIFMFISSSYALDSFYIGEKVPNMKVYRDNLYQTHTGVPYMLKRSDDTFVYCLNPFLDVYTTGLVEGYNYNNPIFNFSDEKIDRMNLIAYYGYGYLNHTDIKWYGVTQFLIWEQTNVDNIYFVDTNTLEKNNQYQSEVEEINRLVNNYYLKPSFANREFEYTINSNYEVVDLNNVLNNYSIVESDIDSYIESNKLYINTKDKGTYKIKFKRESPVKDDYIIYYIDGYQPLLHPGKVQDQYFTIDIKVESGSITINKLDSENKNRIEANLEGAEYGIYDNDKLITTIKTDDKGIAYIDNIKLGNYYVKEISPSLGYLLDNNVYEIDLNYSNKDISITSMENVIENNLVIYKYIKDDRCKLEDGAKFDLYDSSNNYLKTYITENGKINDKLEYGDYYLVQTSGKKGYNFVERLYLNLKEKKDYIYNLYDTKEVMVVDVPNTLVKTNKNYFWIILILLGFILVIKSKKATV